MYIFIHFFLQTAAYIKKNILSRLNDTEKLVSVSVSAVSLIRRIKYDFFIRGHDHDYADIDGKFRRHWL